MARLAALLSWFAFPIYAVQGVGVRLRTPRLTPAPGNPEAALDGIAPEIRLLVLGESSAAGVGLDTLDHGLAACLAREFQAITGRAVRYRAAGFNSATAAQLRDHAVPNLARDDWTHIVLTVGVNDTKNFNTGAHWKKGFGGLLYALKARFPHAAIHWSEVLPMTEVPAMPRPLGDILEIRARMINRIGGRLCAERGAQVVPRMVGLHRDGFCSDGFHASHAGNEGWAAHIAGTVFPKNY